MVIVILLCYDEQHQQLLTYQLRPKAKYKSSKMRFTGVCLAAAIPAMQAGKGKMEGELEGKTQQLVN